MNLSTKATATNRHTLTSKTTQTVDFIFFKLIYVVFVIVDIAVSTKCCIPTVAIYLLVLLVSGVKSRRQIIYSTWAVQLILVGVTFLLHS